MYFAEFLEEKLVLRHGIEHARRGKNDAVGGAESRDQNGQGDELAGPGADHGFHRGGSDGVARSRGDRTERHQISEIGEEVQTREDEAAGKESARKVPLRFQRFTRVVGGELPAFVRPQHRNHSEPKAGEEILAVHSRGVGGEAFRSVPAEREKNRAEYDNDERLDKRHPVEQIRTLPRTPDVDGRDDRNDRHSRDRHFQARQRNDFREVNGKGPGESGHGTARDHQKQTPAI